jgi:uncharacterized protein YbjT (DUF2867 family)
LRFRSHLTAEIAIGDLNDPASLQVALREVDAVFYLAPAFLPREAELGVRFVEIARQAGVRRFVFSSVIHPTLGAQSNHRAKQPDEHLAARGREWSVCRALVD